MTKAHHVPDGWPTLVPRIFVDAPERLVAFIAHVFAAEGSFRPDRPSELRIGDLMRMVSASLESPRDLPYGDRRATVRDAWGNTWQIATHGGRFDP